MTGRPSLYKTTPSKTRKLDCERQHRQGDNGDSGRLDVVTRPLDRNDEKGPKRKGGSDTGMLAT